MKLLCSGMNNVNLKVFCYACQNLVEFLRSHHFLVEG